MNIDSYNKEVSKEVYNIEKVEVVLDKNFTLKQEDNKIFLVGVKSVITDLKTQKEVTEVRGGRYSQVLAKSFKPQNDLKIVLGSEGKLDFVIPKPDYSKMTQKEVLDVIIQATSDLIHKDFNAKLKENKDKINSRPMQFQTDFKDISNEIENLIKNGGLRF